MSAVFLDVAETLCGDVDEDGSAELGNEDATLLEVCLAAHLSCWVELRSTRPVRVPSAYQCCLSRYCAFSCHSSGMVPCIQFVEKPR